LNKTGNVVVTFKHGTLYGLNDENEDFQYLVYFMISAGEGRLVLEEGNRYNHYVNKINEFVATYKDLLCL